MMQKIYNFFREKKEHGQSIIEYAILVAVIAAAVISMKNSASIDSKLSDLATQIGTNIETVKTASSVSGS